MKHTRTILVLGCAFMAFALTATADEGWVDLFNGKNLDGWTQLNGKAKYSVEDGCIVGTSVPNSPNSFLCTDKHYKNFILEFDFKGNPKLNSGCQIRSESTKAYRNGRVHGYQVELEDEAQDRDWSGGIYDEARRGWLYPAEKGSDLAKKFSAQGKRLWMNGEWNHIKVECNGDHIQTWLNGEKRADLHDSMTLSGFIGLQVHSVGSRKEPLSVRWRNIKIKVLPDDSSKK